MRATMHNGRKGKNGVYSVKHNDRNFDLETSPHIDADKAKMNQYIYAGVNVVGKSKTFEEHEKKMYEHYFSEGLQAQNNRYIKNRHKERVQTIDEYRTSERTCPEETIFQIGTKEEHVSGRVLGEITSEFMAWQAKTFPQRIPLDAALHMDEATPHIQYRAVWAAHDKDGNWIASQTKSLEEMGIQRPNPNKPRSRYNNEKITFTEICREKFLELCLNRGLKIELTPKDPSESGLSHLEYKRRQEEKKIQNLETRETNLEETICSLETKVTTLNETIIKKEKKAKDLDDKLFSAENLLREINMKFRSLIARIHEFDEKEIKERLKELKFSIKAFEELDMDEYER